MFLCLLALREQIGGPPLAFNHIYQQASFSQGRKGHKSTRTVEIEIDNFRRSMDKFGLVIVKQRHGAALAYTLDLTRCTVDAAAAFSNRLNMLRGSTDTLGDWIAAPLILHLKWLFTLMRSKVEFAQGRAQHALTLQKQALGMVDDPFLIAVTYAEIARITYRADSDLALDLRDQAMAFAQSGVMTGVMAQIFAPRIQVSFAFLDDVDPLVQCQKLDVSVANYLTAGIDVAGLCRALNSRGLMRRRAMMDTAGIADFQLASALSVTANDPDLAQASLFNILACLEFSDTVPAAVKVEGAELCFWFCTKLNVGGDSVQAELLLAQFHIEATNFSKALTTIHRAVKIMSGERNPADVAFFFYTIANLRLAEARHTNTPPSERAILARLTRSGRIYARVGNVIGTRKVTRLIATLDTKS